jgi:opacity protein-like surface antigen
MNIKVFRKTNFTVSRGKYILFLILILSSSVFSQSKVATTIGQFLKIEPSARAAGMGNAGTSLSGEASSLYYNPASSGRLKNSDVQFTYSNWIADISYDYAALSLYVERVGTFSLQATSLNSGKIDVRTVNQPLGTGEQYTVSDFAVGLGYSLMLTDRVSIGILVNYLQETIWHSGLSAFGVNLGVQYEVENGGLTIGASLLNFGPRASYDGRDLYVDYDQDPAVHGQNDQLPAELRTDSYSLPTTFRVGASYPIKFDESNMILITADLLHPNDNDESVDVGGEWIIFNNFALRGGYRDLFLKDSEGGLVLGAGVKLVLTDQYNLRFDYAWQDYGRLDQTHRFTLGVGF